MLYFDRTPGKAMDEFPQQIRGNYISFEVNPKAKKNQADSSGKFSIKAKSWIQENGVVKEVALGDDVVLSSYSNLYFLSARAESNNEKYWNIYIIEKMEKGFIAYPVVAPKGSERKQMRILKKNFLEVKSLGKNSKGDDFFVKMNEEELFQYFQKKLKKYNYYRFEPVK